MGAMTIVVQQSMLEELGQTAVTVAHVIGRKQVEFLRQVSRHLMKTQHKKGPTHRSRHQRGSRFVNVDVVFEGNEGVAENEDAEDQKVHEKRVLRRR